MLRKALSLKRFPYKSGCACSEKWGRPSTFALLFTRLGGHAPKSWTAAGLARAFFIRFYRFLGGYTPKKHWIFSRETGWSCSEFCMFSALPIKLQSMSCIRVSFVRLRSLEQYTSSSIELYLSLLVFRYISVFLVLLYCLSASAMRAAKRSMDGHSFTGRDCMDL